MPKKKNSSLQHKLSGLLNRTIFLAKLKKPASLPNSLILLLKKMNNMRKSKLVRRYDHYYGPVTEYEFSPPNTHLVRFRRKIGKISLKKLCSDILLFSKCLGSLEMGFEIDRSDHMGMRDLTPRIDESVDERAERFIQRFYEEMTRQRQEYNF